MLSPLIWLPFVGALIIAFVPLPVVAKQARAGALATSGIALIWTLWLFTQFDLGLGGGQMAEFVPWLPVLGLNYDLSLDGLSLMMLSLNSLLTWIALYSSKETLERPRLFYSLVLLVSGGVAGAFLAQNLLLFFLLFELELVPLYLLVAIWGGERRNYAATKFLLYTAIAGALILTAFLGVVWLQGGLDFSYEAVAQHHLSLRSQVILLAILLVGFGIKIPLVPFHTWLPDTYVAASPPVAILLGGVLAKLGTYGIFRFGLGLFPDAWALLSPGLAIWGGGDGGLWLCDGDRPKGHQAHGGLQLHWPHGLCPARRCRLHRAEPDWGDHPDGLPRLDFGPAVPPSGPGRRQGRHPSARQP